MELFSLKPNCEGVKMLFLFTNFVMFFSIIFSNTFEITQRSEIGRKSPSDFGVETLAIGTTYTILNDSGKVSSLMHLLNNFASYTGWNTVRHFYEFRRNFINTMCRVNFDVINAITYIMFSNFMKNKRKQAAFTVNFEQRIISWRNVFRQRGTSSGKIIT